MRVRYVVVDSRRGQYQGIGRKNPTPWRVIDTVTNSTVDEYATKKPALMHAVSLNAAAWRAVKS